MFPKQLVQLLRSQIIPWTDSTREPKIVVARAAMRAADLPDGVTMTRRKIVGQRVVVKNRRMHGNLRFFVANWPEDNLHELAVPKLICVVSGVADYLLGDSCIQCNSGTFFMVPPLVPHQRAEPVLQGERRRDGSSCVLLHALAYKHGVQFWYSRSEGERHINEFTDNYLIPSLTSAQILHSLVDEATEEKSHFESVAAGFIAAFFAIVAREIEAGNYMHPGPKENVPAPARAASFSEQVQEYVETHCHKRLRLDDVAAHMYMSSSQFSRRMRQEMEITFVELLTRVRIERACKLLRETDFTINIIGILLGFRSPSHFQTLFRSRVGSTPMEYRRKNTSKN